VKVDSITGPIGKAVAVPVWAVGLSPGKINASGQPTRLVLVPCLWQIAGMDAKRTRDLRLKDLRRRPLVPSMAGSGLGNH